MTLSQADKELYNRAQSAAERLPPGDFLSWLRGFTKSGRKFSKPLLRELRKLKQEAENAG